MITKQNVLFVIATTEFRHFTQGDWMSYQGCESADPLIAELDEFAVIIDGDKVCVLDYDGNETLFFLNES